MSADIASAVQRGLYARLTADAGVVALVAGRVFDRVPARAPFPFVTIADAQVIEDGTDCREGSELFVDLHVWSDAVGHVEVKKIAGAMRRALQADLDLGATHALVDLSIRAFQIVSPGDEDTLGHGVLTIRLLTETAD